MKKKKKKIRKREAAKRTQLEEEKKERKEKKGEGEKKYQYGGEKKWRRKKCLSTCVVLSVWPQSHNIYHHVIETQFLIYENINLVFSVFITLTQNFWVWVMKTTLGNQAKQKKLCGSHIF